MKPETPFYGHSISHMKSLILKPSNDVRLDLYLQSRCPITREVYTVRLDLYTRFEGDPGAFSLLFSKAEEADRLIAELQKIREFLASTELEPFEDTCEQWREERIARDHD